MLNVGRQASQVHGKEKIVQGTTQKYGVVDAKWNVLSERSMLESSVMCCHVKSKVAYVVRGPDQCSFVCLEFFPGASPFPGIAGVGIALWNTPSQHGIEDHDAGLQKGTYIEWAASGKDDRGQHQEISIQGLVVDYEINKKSMESKC